MLLKLYHNTSLGNVQSILEKGLIPAGSENGGQCWESYYHKTGVYFVYANDLTPEQRMMTVDESVFKDELEFLIDCVEALIYVELPVDPEIDYDKVVPDEEVLEPITAPPSKETFKFSVDPEQCESIVYLGKVKPEFIKTIYVPYDIQVEEYVKKHITNTSKIKFLTLF